MFVICLTDLTTADVTAYMTAYIMDTTADETGNKTAINETATNEQLGTNARCMQSSVTA